MKHYNQAIQNLLRFVAVILCLSTTAWSAAPQSINYQGLLKDGTGTPVPNGNYSIAFTIYDAAAGGNNLWTETQTVTTSAGLFAVLLGSVSTPIPDAVFSDTVRYLEIKVGADPALTPREKLASVPYSHRVSTVDKASGGSINGALSFGNSSTPILYMYESGSLNPTRPIIAHSPAFPSYGLSYDDLSDRMEILGNGQPRLSIGLDSKFIGVNRNYTVSPAEYFGIHAPTDSGQYGGTYITTNFKGWPFYGYYNQFYSAWHYLDEAGTWKMNVGSLDRMRVTQSGLVGIGTLDPSLAYLTVNNGSNIAFLGLAGGAAVFLGDVQVVGTLTKSSGSFKIDHPLDPANKYLYHSFVESPDMKNIYDGVVTTDAKGNATVTLPDWFGALNKDFRYQLTVIGDFAQVIISQEIASNQFSIRSDKPNVKVSWQVTGTRQDAYANAHRIQVETDKPLAEQGRYLHPKELGLLESLSIYYESNHNTKAGSNPK